MAVGVLAGCTGSPPDAPTAPFVALPGGTFEGGLSAWRPEDSATRMRRTQRTPHGGSDALEVFAPGGGPAVVVPRAPVVTSTRAGAGYAVRVWARAGTEQAGAYVALEETGPDGASRGSKRRAVPGDGAWHEVVVELRARSDGSALRLRLGAQDASAVSGVAFDDVSVRGAGTPAAGSSPSATLGGTLVGSNAYARRGQPYVQAVRRQQGRFGGLQILRTFYDGLPAPWPGDAGVVAGLPVVVSFKGEPGDIIAGVHDQELLDWFRGAPRDRDVYWTYFHEPENEVQLGHFTEAEFRDAWAHLDHIASEVGNGRLRATLVLTCWTLQPASRRDWRDYYPGDDVVDVLGWDCYNTEAQRGQYIEPERMFGAAADAAESVDKPWGIAELGSSLAAGDDGSGRAAWLTACATWLRERRARFVLYFDAPVGGDFQLTDAESVAAWRRAITGN